MSWSMLFMITQLVRNFDTNFEHEREPLPSWQGIMLWRTNANHIQLNY